jgi:DNA invertase Pin-like site-specific DNA recombinase
LWARCVIFEIAIAYANLLCNETKHVERRIFIDANHSSWKTEVHLQIDALQQVKCGRIYQEKASGAKADRPELMKLLDNARKGDVVIVWKLDRLARSIRQLLDTMALLNERGVELYSLTENINTTTPSGKLTFHIFAALAEFERDILRQRVNAGLKAARASRRQTKIPYRSGLEKGTRTVALRRLHQRAGCRRVKGSPTYALARFIEGSSERLTP